MLPRRRAGRRLPRQTAACAILVPCETWKTRKVVKMALTRNFKKTVVARVERDSAFAEALLDEAATLNRSNEPETARVILRDLVNVTLGFEARNEN